MKKEYGPCFNCGEIHAIDDEVCPKDFDWKPYFGCSAWFNLTDGFLEIVAHTKTARAGSNDGPIWTVVGEKDNMLRISVNMVNISECPKKFTRILKDFGHL